MWWTPTFLVSERINSELDFVLLQKKYISPLKIQPPTTTTTLLPHSYTVALFFCGLTSLCHWHFQCLRSSLSVKTDKTDRMWIFFFSSELETTCNSSFLSRGCTRLAVFCFTHERWFNWNVNVFWAFFSKRDLIQEDHSILYMPEIFALREWNKFAVPSCKYVFKPC